MNGVVHGVAADATLIARLDLKIGDQIKIGAATFALRAELVSEPDKLAGGIGFGSRVLMSDAAFAATGLDQPGAIVRRVARVALGAEGAVASDAEVEQFADALTAAFPDAGWELRRRDAVSPQFSRNQQRFAQLLTLVALTALVAGGAGVANAVDGFVARKRNSFAILKALGAPAARVFAIALTEVLLVAALAIAGGLALGAAFPFLLDRTLGRLGRPALLAHRRRAQPRDRRVLRPAGDVDLRARPARPRLCDAGGAAAARRGRGDADAARFRAGRGRLRRPADRRRAGALGRSAPRRRLYRRDRRRLSGAARRRRCSSFARRAASRAAAD